MISDGILRLAVERSLISEDQAEGLRALAREAAPPDGSEAAVDDEALRFITGFADIFVTIGIVLFLGALYYLASSKAGGWPSAAVVPAGAWVLAEFFTRRRRMALPSIVLLVIFALGSFWTILLAYPGEITPPFVWTTLFMTAGDGGGGVVVAGLETVALTCAHYLRFRVPITVAADVAALCITILGIVHQIIPGLTGAMLSGLLLTCGILVFALAMRFDLSDPERRTRRSDIAFWLHLLAAPLVVHPLIRGFVLGIAAPAVSGALSVLGIFFLLGIVAIVIDRRAMLVSGLVYAGLASAKLIETFGFNGSSLLLPSVLLILGAFILLISAGWHPLRRMFLQILPAAFAARLPHPLAVSST